MIIDLRKSKLFTEHPDTRFSREYGLPKGLWTELWKRHILLGYDKSELSEYFQIKTGRKMSNRSLNRWIVRTEIYQIASPVTKKGAYMVNSNIFGGLEDLIIKEFTKNARFSGTHDIKIII